MALYLQIKEKHEKIKINSYKPPFLCIKMKVVIIPDRIFLFVFFLCNNLANENYRVFVHFSGFTIVQSTMLFTHVECK